MSAPTQNNTPEDLHEVGKYVKSQIRVGLALVVFTVIAVAVSFLPFHSSSARILAVFVFVLINAVLVSAISMHLKSEKRTITQFLIFTAIFTGVLFALTMLAQSDSTNLLHH